MLSLFLLVLSSTALEVSIGDLIRVYELGKEEAEVADVYNKEGLAAMDSVIDEFYDADYEDAPNTCAEYVNQPDPEGVYANWCTSPYSRGFVICPEECNGWDLYFDLVKTFHLLDCKDTASRCQPSNSGKGMCGNSDADRKMSGDYLSDCPAECYIAGHDHGQCNEKVDLHPQCNFVAPRTEESLVFDVNLDNGAQKYYEDVADFAACMGLCYDHDLCDGVTYQMSNKRCWLKEGSTGFEAAGSKNYRQSTYMTCCKWTEEKEEMVLEAETIPASEASPYHVVTGISQCKLLCDGTHGCNGYTHQGKNGRCWLKKDATAFVSEEGKGLAYRTSAMKICGLPRKEL